MILHQVIFDRGMMHTIVVTIFTGVRFDTDVGAKVNFQIGFRRADLVRRPINEGDLRSWQSSYLAAFAAIPFALFQMDNLDVMSKIGVVGERFATIVT